uniref:BED-type domain-containing protein n=1 Tax=Leptobrachium leishanense TaxID=445787 RepID=A0A8C5QL81_9ANUR
VDIRNEKKDSSEWDFLQARSAVREHLCRYTSLSKASDVRAAQVQSTVVSKHTRRNSAVWEFFRKCAADRTVAICNLCQMRLKRGKDTGCLGTTCLRRHMTTCHAFRWCKTLHRSSSLVSTPTICLAMSLTPTSTDRDNATVMDVPGPSSQCDIIPVAEDLRSQIIEVRVIIWSAVVSKHTSRNSAVWEFFKKCAADRTIAICNLCQMRIKRGKDIPHLGTTCLRRHMTTCHASHWHNTLHRSSSSSSVSTPNMSCHVIAWGGGGTANTSTTSSVTNHSTSKSKASHLLRCRALLSQRTHAGTLFVWEFFKKCAVERSVAICNLCQMRLKRGKDTRHLGTTCLRRHMNNCHTFRWRKTLRRSSSSSSSVSTPTVCPAMSLPTTSTDRDDASVMDKKYSPNHPQAQRLNASLAKLLALQLLPFQLVDSAPFREFAECAVPQWQVPKHHYFSRKAIPALYQHVEDNVIQSLGKAVSNKVHVTLDTWSSKHGQGRYTSFKAHWVTLIAAGRDPRRAACMSHTVLELVCLGDRSHTGPEILSALQVQVLRWLSPRQLELGMIVCDNGSNLLSALRKGKLTHVPCLAHVLNLVVQRFLTKYPGLPELLIQARKVCSHLRWSFPASIRLAEIQREFHLPTNRLMCDMPTRWNSTLAMLQRLHKQQRAINEYLCEYGTRTGSGQLGFPTPQWLMIKDACTVLSPFEEATRMGNRDSACISGDSSREGFVCPETQGLVRGWEEEVHNTVILIDQEDSEANATSNLRRMGSVMMQSLLKDPRTRAIKERDHYWLATLLDPRYKGKVAELILPTQREHRMKKLKDALKRHLCNTFPGTGRLPSADRRASEAAGDQRNSGEDQGRLTDAFLNFFSPRHPGTSNVGTHCQHLHHMVQDYLGARADLDTFPANDPLAYWVLRLDHWPELSQYDMQLLGCPSSSVLSERTFSAAGGFVTDKRVCLSTDSVDRLTFIENESVLYQQLSIPW